MSLLKNIVNHGNNIASFKNAVAAKRIASAWLFVGPSGIGKKKTALAFAQILVCENTKVAEACGHCPPCLRIEKQQSESLLLVEPKGAQIKIEQARQIIDFLSLMKIGRSRVVIVDGGEYLNPAAANALLKTLEEPPEDTFLILIAKSLSGILPTIRSRVQVMRFATLSPAQIKQIAGVEEWVAATCGGSIEQAQRLAAADNFKALRENFFNRLEVNCSNSGKGTFPEVKDVIGDKEASLFLLQALQLWVRDLFRLRILPESHFPADLAWSKVFLHRGDEFLNELWEYVQTMERDVLGNVDRQLCFESFFQRIR